MAKTKKPETGLPTYAELSSLQRTTDTLWTAADKIEDKLREIYAIADAWERRVVPLVGTDRGEAYGSLEASHEAERTRRIKAHVTAMTNAVNLLQELQQMISKDLLCRRGDLQDFQKLTEDGMSLPYRTGHEVCHDCPNPANYGKG